jgi:photosystem II stability/assembly factor-like uncharacterized protein
MKRIFAPCFWLSASLMIIPGRIYSQWEEQVTATVNWSSGLAVDACDANHAVVSVYTQGVGCQVVMTADGGESWVEIQPSDLGSARVYDLAIVDSLNIWLAAADPPRIYHTTDGGQTWTIQYDDSTVTDFFNYIEMFDLHDGVAMADALSGDIPVILTTTDGGHTWLSVDTSAIGGRSGDLWRRIDFVNPAVGYFYPSGVNPQHLYKTTDGGVTWVETAYPDYAMVLKFYDEALGLAIPGDQVIYRTVDGGATWTPLTTPHAGWGIDIEFSSEDPAHIWMVAGDRLFYSSDTGNTWSEQLTVTNGRDIVFIDSNIGWFLADDGIYHTTNGGRLGTIDPPPTHLPGRFMLYQNIPNPWNPVTTIRYDLPRTARVQITVFNILGDEIITLVNGRQQAGQKFVTWNGRNGQGGPVGAGVYLYQLRANDYVATRTMVLLR